MATPNPISLSIRDFCAATGIGQTLCRQMISDGRLRAARVGKKKILVEVASWHEYLHRNAVEGLADYDGTRKAVEQRKANAAERKAGRAKLSEVLRDSGLLR